MKILKPIQKDEKASICSQGNCITVHGETAKIVNTVVAVISILLLVSVAREVFE